MKSPSLKFSTLFLALLCFAFESRSQSMNYHSFKVDIMAGVDPADLGGSVSIQPHYRLSNAFALGVRLDEIGFVTLATAETTSTFAHFNGIFSACPSLEYYLLNHGLRPFIGAGAGFFYVNGATMPDPQ